MCPPSDSPTQWTLASLANRRETPDAPANPLLNSGAGQDRLTQHPWGRPVPGRAVWDHRRWSRQRDRVEHYIAKGIEEGATLVTGGGRPKHLERGYCIEPTVFAGVDNKQVIAQEEIFGPVLSVIPADNDERAVDIANDTIYGCSTRRSSRRMRRGLGRSRADCDLAPWDTTVCGST